MEFSLNICSRNNPSTPPPLAKGVYAFALDDQQPTPKAAEDSSLHLTNGNRIWTSGTLMITS